MPLVGAGGPVEPGTINLRQVIGAQASLDAIVARLDAMDLALPRGLMGEASISADQGSITTLVDLTNLSVTFDSEAGRKYWLIGGVHMSSTVANDEGGLRVRLGNGGAINRARVQINTSGRRYYVIVADTHVPGAGTTTYKLSAERIQGTGTLTANAGANEEGFLRVFDVGPG